MPLIVLSLIIFAVLAGVSSQLIFKFWVSSMGVIPLNAGGIVGVIARILQSPLMLLGLGLYGLGFLAWIFLLSRASLSLVYPIILSANIVLVLISSFLLFRESLGLVQIIGIGVIVAGIFLVFAA